MHVLLTTLNAKFIHSSLALRCLVTACRAKGLTNVSTAEYTINQNVYDILRHMYSLHPDVIGFSCYIWNIEMTCHLISLLKEVMPAVRIVVGGPEVSYTAREVLTDHPQIDYVMQGEGEEIWPAFITELDAGRDGTNIVGVLGRVQGDIRGNEIFREVRNLDTLPFPYDGEDFNTLAHKIMYYESSRGCPFHCQYCLSGNNDTVRFRSVPLVLKELQQFVAAGVHQIKFVDRTFNCSPAHYRPMIEYMIGVDRPINFHLEIEPAILKDEDLALLAKAPKGRIQLEMGIQTTYAPTLKAIHRHNDWPHMEYIMEKLLSFGNMHLHLDLIVGLPYEDFHHLRWSFHDIYSLHPHKLQIGFLKLLKGSGIRRDYPDDYHYDPCGPYEVLATTWLPYEDVQYMKVFEDVFERTYNAEKFQYTLQYIEQFFTDDYFRLYEILTDAWLSKGYDRIAINDETLCQFVWEAIQQMAVPDGVKAVCRELLALDMLTFFRFRLPVDFLQWQPCSRDERDALFRDESWLSQYIPEYKFTSWRDVTMRYRIWRVSKDTLEALRRYQAVPSGDCYIIAEKQGKRAAWQVVPAYMKE